MVQDIVYDSASISNLDNGMRAKYWYILLFSPKHQLDFELLGWFNVTLEHSLIASSDISDLPSLDLSVIWRT